MKKKDSLKPRLYGLMLLALFSISISGQTLEFGLQKGNCQRYASSLFTYGFSSRSKSVVFCIYKSNFQLKVLDSLIISQASTSSDDYLQTQSDTLHGFLNIYLQKKAQKSVTILRFNKKFELAATVENVDVARLNSISGFETELFYFKNYAYTIKTVDDTSGKQFYLNKYALKSDLKNFEYSLAWQFPFERKNINSAHIFYADYKQVLLYVNVNNGAKKGQWILKINAVNGQLCRGTKLNERGDGATYEFGSFMADTIKKTVTVAGQLFKENQWKENDRQPNIINAPFAFVYLIQMDSTGDVTARDIFKAPIQDLKQGARKSANAYILRVCAMTKNIEDKIFLETDVYKSADNLQTFLYSNTGLMTISPGEEQLVMEKYTVTVNPQIEKFYVVPDKLDINGKLFNDSLGQFEKLFYKPIPLAVKQDFKLLADGNAAWLLKKSYSKKNNINFTWLAPVNKIYKLTTVEDFQTSTEPVFIPLSDAFFLISNQISEDKYRIKLVAW